MWGALIGAAIAGGVALYENYVNSEAAADAKSEAKAAAAALKTQYSELISDVNSHYARTEDEQKEADEAKQSYLDMLAESDSSQTVEDFYKKVYGVDENGETKSGEFEYDKELEDFYDPRKEQIENLAARSATARMIGSGAVGSTDAAEAIAEAVANKDEELYNNALTAYNTDRSQKYSEWNSYLQQKQNELQNLLTGQSNDISNAKALYDVYNSEDEAYWQDIMNARIAALNAGYAADSAAANTGNYSTDIGGMAQMIGAGANIGYKTGTAFSDSGTSSTSAFEG